MSVSTFELCVGCGCVLPEDHGFSNMCDTCNPDKIDIEVLVPPPKQEIRVPKVRLIEDKKPVVRRVKVKPDDAKVAHVVPPSFDIGISEERSYDEIFEFKAANLTKVSALKMQLLKTLPHTEYSALKSELTMLGRRDQLLAALLRRKNHERKAANLTVQGDRDLANIERNHDFKAAFFDVAKASLSPEIFQMLCRLAGVQSGQAQD